MTPSLRPDLCLLPAIFEWVGLCPYTDITIDDDIVTTVAILFDKLIIQLVHAAGHHHQRFIQHILRQPLQRPACTSLDESTASPNQYSTALLPTSSRRITTSQRHTTEFLEDEKYDIPRTHSTCE